MLEKYLEDIGLSDKEAKVYLALLTRDTSSVLEIAKDTGINRTTVYPLLERLMTIGLASEVKEGKKAHYQAAPPERLETYIEKRKADLNEKQNLLSEIIPQLRSVSRKSGEQPIVKYFEGRDGILKLASSFYDSQDTDGVVYMVYSRDRIKKYFSENERAQAKAHRISHKIKSCVIYSSSTETFPTTDDTGERYKVNETSFPLPAQITIFNDYIRVYTMGETVAAILIKSKDFADTLRSLFELSIQGIKKLPKDI